MHYHFKVHKEGNAYWAQGLELDGCFTHAKTKKELQERMEEVLNLYLSEPEDSKYIFPLPKKSVRGKNIVRIKVHPRVEIAMLVRMSRLKSKLTQQKVADKIGIDVSAYQRYESPKAANPTWTTLDQIKRALPILRDLLAN